MSNETSTTESQTTVSDSNTTDQDRDGVFSPSDAFTSWVASSALRTGVVIVGIFLLLTALGQLSGIDILGMTAELLGTEVGRWLLVAVVALALIVVAVYGFRDRSD